MISQSFASNVIGRGLDTVSTARGSGWVNHQDQENINKSSASTSYPSATADGTDCVQVQNRTFEARPRGTHAALSRLTAKSQDQKTKAKNRKYIDRGLRLNCCIPYQETKQARAYIISHHSFRRCW